MSDYTVLNAFRGMGSDFSFLQIFRNAEILYPSLLFILLIWIFQIIPIVNIADL